MAFKMLQPAINVGLKEQEFWEMTIAEIERYLKGAEWRIKTQAQLDYTLADLIGVSVARVFSKETQFPSIDVVYPSLFEAEAKQRAEEEKRVNESTNRFLEFALKHNAKVNAQKEV